MREFLLVVAVVLGLAALSAVALVPWRTLFYVSVWVVGAGIVLGLPTGVLYHVQLYRVLKPLGKLPSGWIWRPIELNAKLGPRDRWRVLPWCYLGALGFFVIIIGFVTTVASMILANAQGV